MTSAPLVFMVAPMTLSPTVTADGHGFAGEHRFVEAGTTFHHLAVHRHFLARTHAQAIADLDLGKRHIGLGAIRGQAARRFRRQSKQCANGGGRLGPGLNSSNWPSRVSETMTAAASK